MNQTRILTLLISVSDPHHHARGFDRACNINLIDCSAVTGLTSNGSNSVTIRQSAATKICVTALSYLRRRSGAWAQSQGHSGLPSGAPPNDALTSPLYSRHIRGELVQRLIAVFDGTKADHGIALRRARGQLPERQHGLAVALLGERDGEAKQSGIVILVRAVVHLHQMRPLDAAKAHAVRIDRAVGPDHVEAP